ncbi:MAG: hypothetical protein JWN48_3285, partial [Myxococcaceae bacterium]|nr:hypothetical protein [Myxococcaceae bacterium]
YVPVSFVISRRHDPDYRFRDDGYGYAYLAFSVVGAATVLVSALSQTVNEQRARAYRELVVRQDLEPGRKPDARRSAPHRPADRLSWGLCGTRQRLELSTAFRF